ncbi:MAG: phenylalanine--tRNA ligase subunit beta [Tissierellia bacterium]|nr:phenylalanine--tRNA ligase subunit beta [Tissierellia bacterium]
MLLPVNWLKKYVDIDMPIKELSDGLSNSGSHVESIAIRSEGIEKIVVGKILDINKHPNADKLVLCSVDIGDKEPLELVTGAPNVEAGQYVMVAVLGAKLKGDFEIKATDFRGIESKGMLCSLAELGYSQSVIPRKYRDGIFVFQDEQIPGEDALKLLDLYEPIIEFEITPNRPDCLSIIGMARETAGTFSKELKIPKIEIENEVDDIKDYMKSIKIETENCNRYYSRVLKDVVVKESPLWLQNALMAAGVRPVSNIVDLTNYVMLEFGNPLHAFDLDFLKNQTIGVRQAKDGEIIKTLDEVDRKLTKDDMIITDGENPIGIAGIMGGFNSEINDDTKTVVLEGANFDQKCIRLSSKRLGLRTEASARFEKGLDPNLPQLAVDRVCQLAEEIGAATVVKGSIDIYKNPPKRKVIELRPERANALLGTDLSVEQMLKYLNGLEIKSGFDGTTILAEIPSFRNDLNIEVDLIEEIGRLYGFDNLVPTPIRGDVTVGEKPKFKDVEAIVKPIMSGLGFNEIMTYSFISPSTFDKLCVPEDSKLRDVVKILNPLGQEYSIMRTTMIGNLLDVLSRNRNRNIPSMLAYEIGNTFSLDKDEDDLPTERLKMIIGFYDHDKDFYYLKESLEILFERLGITDYDFVTNEENSTFHPGRCADILINGDYVGAIGEIHPDIRKNYDIKDRVYAAEIDFQTMVELYTSKRVYKPLPKYPAMKRDFAFVMDRDLEMRHIKEIAIREAKDLFESFEVFDIYTGSQIDDDKKSVAFSISFRSHDRTLVDEEVNRLMENIIESIEENLDAELRK